MRYAIEFFIGMDIPKNFNAYQALETKCSEHFAYRCRQSDAPVLPTPH